MELIVAILLLIITFYLTFEAKRYSFQREYKKCESPIEEMLIKKLHEEGFKPYAQISCGKYRIDIAVYYKGKKIAIECDGEKFHSSDKQKEHDRIKDMVLRKNRWTVYRFTGKEIYRNSLWCVKVIQKNIKQ